MSSRNGISFISAWNLEKMGMPLDTIAKVVEEDVSVVRQWLKPAK